MKDEIGFVQSVASVTTCPETLKTAQDRALALREKTSVNHHKNWLDSIIKECETRSKILDAKFKKSCDEMKKFQPNDLNDCQRMAH